MQNVEVALIKASQDKHYKPNYKSISSQGRLELLIYISKVDLLIYTSNNIYNEP